MDLYLFINLFLKIRHVIFFPFPNMWINLIKRWVIEVHGAPGTLYANETFQLQVDFPEHYPMEAPQVDFFCCLNLGTFPTASKLYFMIQVIFLHPAPLHPHIYSNGHICLGTFKFLTFIAIYDLLCISGYLVVVLGGIKSMAFAGRTLLCLLGLGWFIQSDKYCLRVILFWFSCGRIPN